jgi:hypothetical protein
MALTSVKSIDIKKCDKQIYTIKDSHKIIPKPSIGCLLIRSDKSSGSGDVFVVVRVGYKKRGNNRGITDTVMLDKIIKRYDDNVTYEPTTHPLILSLTNHGDWWSKSLADQYLFEWDPPISFRDGARDGARDGGRGVTSSIPIPILPTCGIPTPTSSIYVPLTSKYDTVSDSNSWDETNRLSPMKINKNEPDTAVTQTQSNQRRWTMQYQSNIPSNTPSDTTSDSHPNFKYLNNSQPVIVIQDNPT